MATISASLCRLIAVGALLCAAGMPGVAQMATPAPIRRLPLDGVTVDRARALIDRKVAQIRTMTCELALSKKRDRKPTRKVSTGTLELERDAGAYAMLARKGETEEYFVTPEVIWAYDHKDKEAQFIPTSMPVIGFFVKEAVGLNILLALDEDTVVLRGAMEIEGEPCWMLEGKTPGKLEIVGVPPSKVKVWISQRDGVPRMIKVPDKAESIITLRSVVINRDVDRARFQFTPPAGVKAVNILGF
jgi:outer membrane lipoprotein-sorting protein